MSDPNERCIHGFYRRCPVGGPDCCHAESSLSTAPGSTPPNWEWDGTYPTRCKIVDAGGLPIVPGIVARTPNESKPHIEKLGTAELLPSGDVKITLDDGNILWGYECWWTAVSNAGGER